MFFKINPDLTVNLDHVKSLMVRPDVSECDPGLVDVEQGEVTYHITLELIDGESVPLPGFTTEKAAQIHKDTLAKKFNQTMAGNEKITSR